MRVQHVLLHFGLLLVTLGGLSACGGAGHSAAAPDPVPVPTPALPPTLLTGNWSIAGARDPLTYPIFSTSIIVHGSELSGEMNVQIECSPQFHIGGSVPLTGQIATDGSFQASLALPQTGGSAAPSLFQVSLSGNSPTAASSSSWTGTYTLSSSSHSLDGTSCAYSHSESFTAMPIASFTGTYSGSVSRGFPSSGLGANAAFVVTVAQQPPALLAHGPTSSYQLPLSATISVTGSPCFTSGTTVGGVFPSLIGGDTLGLRFLMDDGSQLTLQGSLDSLTGASLTANAIATGGGCDLGFAMATLTRS